MYYSACVECGAYIVSACIGTMHVHARIEGLHVYACIPSLACFCMCPHLSRAERASAFVGFNLGMSVYLHSLAAECLSACGLRAEHLLDWFKG
jgi:hypothetical protein